LEKASKYHKPICRSLHEHDLRADKSNETGKEWGSSIAIDLGEVSYGRSGQHDPPGLQPKRIRSGQFEGGEKLTKATKSHDILEPMLSYPRAMSWYGMTGIIKE